MILQRNGRLLARSLRRRRIGPSRPGRSGLRIVPERPVGLLRGIQVVGQREALGQISFGFNDSIAMGCNFSGHSIPLNAGLKAKCSDKIKTLEPVS